MPVFFSRLLYSSFGTVVFGICYRTWWCSFFGNAVFGVWYSSGVTVNLQLFGNAILVYGIAGVL